MTLPYRKAERVGEKVTGIIPVLDAQYGNVCTNIPKALFNELNPELGQNFRVRVYREDQFVAESIAPYRRTFGEVPPKTPLIYVNSLLNMAVALNLAISRGSMASAPARNGRLKSVASDDPVSTILLSEIY